MSCCASTPSAGPRPLPAGIRSCVVARPRSIFRTRSPSTRRSPDSGAASAVIPGTSGVASGEIAICSIGALSQNGEIGSSSSSGSAQASNPQRDAARSAAVCSRTWKGACSGRPGCGWRRRHAGRYAALQQRNCQARPPPVMRSVSTIASLITSQFRHTLLAGRRVTTPGAHAAIAATTPIRIAGTTASRRPEPRSRARAA